MTRFILFLPVLLLIAVQVFSQGGPTPLRLNGYTQGTTYSITYFDDKGRDLQPDIEKILQNFSKSLSTYDSSSVVSRVNRNDEDVVPDDYFITCFKKSMEVSKSTGGAFDITVGPLVKVWGFAKKKKQNVDSSMIDSLLKFTGYQLAELKDNKVIKKDPRVTLDFNAIAQGYSVDVVSHFLESKNIISYLVEIGGEVFAKNKKPDDEQWKVGIEKPVDNPNSENPLKAIVKLENKALSTSGNYRKFYIENGIRYSHEINPHTGYPAHNTILSASVFADDCMTADAYATAFMVMGLEKTIQFLSEHREIQVYLIYSGEDGNNKIYESPELMKIITEAE
jgi:FAD:protein FMN transferase